MSILHSVPTIVTEGLIYSLDASNPKCLNGAENLLTYSQQLDNSAWNNTGFQGLATVTTNSIVAPDGTQTAETLHFAPAPNQSRRTHWIYSPGLDGVYTVSAHVKKGDMSEIELYVSANRNPYPGVKYNFDTDTVLSIGSAVAAPVGIATTCEVKRTLLSDGWVRISATTHVTTTFNEIAFIGVTTGYTYAWGVQLEERHNVSSYYETTDTTKTADNHWNSSVGGYIGTFSGAPAYDSDNGGSIVFTGVSTVGFTTNSYVDLTGSNTLTSATFIAWIYRTGTVIWPGIIFSRSTVSSGMSLRNDANEVAYVWNNAGNTFTWQSGLVVPENEWCMIAVSVNPTSATAYLYRSSGITSATNTVSHSSTTLDAIEIGRDNISGSTRIFDGKISVAQVYNRALTQEEITQNYEITKGRYGY